MVRPVDSGAPSHATRPGAEPLGDGALRLPLPPNLDPRTVLEALRAQPRVIDAVVTERHACIYFDPAVLPDDPGGVLMQLAQGVQTRFLPPASLITVRARYDGPDLARVAELAHLSVDVVIAIHAARTYTVRVVGFMPGFAYLGELDPRIVTPRLPTPRTRVPQGAIAIAGRRTGIYPLASPGGWNLIASAIDFIAFHPQTGAALQLGDQVRFEPA